MAFVFGTSAAGGSGTFTGGTITGDTSMAANKQFSVATADKLKVNSVIVPQTISLQYIIDPTIYPNNSDNLWIADNSYQLTGASIVYSANDNTGATLQIQKLTGTTAPGGGSNLFQSALALDGTINTVLTATLTATTANLQFTSGNRMGITFAGSPASLDLIILSLTLKRI